MSLFSELKRRNVFRVAIAYLALAWLLTEVAGTLFPAFGIPDWGIRFVVIVFVLGFVPTLIFSWVYELTPEGLKREKDVVREVSITRLTARRLDLFTIGLIVVALAFILADRLWLTPRLADQAARAAEVVTETVQTPEPDPRFPPNSIAVLPFVNMSDDTGNEYFSDGISEELLNLLSGIQELRVIARTSSFSFKGTNATITDIARELNVGHLLEGSVRKSGNQVRITVQLIRAHDSTHLWSETYDRTLDNIFAIQDEIANAVVKQLRIELLGPRPMAEEIEPEAYVLYLQALHLARQDTSEALEDSAALYQQVLDITPDSAAAWNGLASVYRRQTRLGRKPFDEGFGLVREAANKALESNPEYAPAFANLGWTAMDFDGDLAAAVRQFARALEQEPTNLSIIADAALLARNLGRLDEAIAMMEHVLVGDPVNPVGHARLGNFYYFSGRLDAAIVSSQTALKLSPGLLRARYQICEALLQKGEPEAALDVAQQEPLPGYRLMGQALAYHALGKAAESDAALASLIEVSEQVAAYNIAYILAYRGEADPAFMWLEKAVRYRDPGLGNIMVNPLFANVHEDPRWLPFLERIGKSPEQLDAIDFRVRLPD